MTQNLEFMTFTEVYKFNLEEGKNTGTCILSSCQNITKSFSKIFHLLTPISFWYSSFTTWKLCPMFDSLPKNKITDKSKLKVFEDDKMNVIKKSKFDLGTAENIVGNSPIL